MKPWDIKFSYINTFIQHYYSVRVFPSVEIKMWINVIVIRIKISSWIIYTYILHISHIIEICPPTKENFLSAQDLSKDICCIYRADHVLLENSYRESIIILRSSFDPPMQEGQSCIKDSGGLCTEIVKLEKHPQWCYSIYVLWGYTRVFIMSLNW